MATKKLNAVNKTTTSKAAATAKKKVAPVANKKATPKAKAKKTTAKPKDNKKEVEEAPKKGVVGKIVLAAGAVAALVGGIVIGAAGKNKAEEEAYIAGQNSAKSALPDSNANDQQQS